MSKLPALLPQNADILDRHERPVQLPTFGYPPAGSSQLDVEVTKIQADTFERLARMNVEVARIRSYTELSLASMNLDADETRHLIWSATEAMSRTLDVYRGADMSGSTKFRAKSKLSGLFAKSCTITVEVQRFPQRREIYFQGPAK